MIINNKDGAALVIVLILLVTGSLLVGSLFVVAQSHINSAVREEANSKAFQNADAGVEFVKANASKIVSINKNDGDYLYYDNGNLEFKEAENNITSSNLNISNNQLKFSIQANSKSEFTSTGIYKVNNKEFKKNITFELSNKGGNLTNILNLEGSEEEINFKGNSSPLELGIATISEEISPTWDEWEEVRNQAVPLSSFDSQETFDKKIIEIDKKNKNKTTLKNNTNFKNSIVFIDGNLNMPTNVSWENTIIVLKNDLKFTGFPTDELKNSIFVVYEAQEIHFAGTTPDEISLDIDFSKLPQEFETMEEYIPTLQVSNWKEN